MILKTVTHPLIPNPTEAVNGFREKNFMILQKVISALALQLDLDPTTITKDSNILTDFGADSLDIVELVMHLEHEYNLVITDESVHSFQTVGEIADFIESQVNK